MDKEQTSSVVSRCVHVSACGFGEDVSMKPPPGRKLALELVDEYLLDGFLTTSEVLMVLQSEEWIV